MADWFESLEIDPQNKGNKKKPDLQQLNIHWKKVLPIAIIVFVILLFIAFRPWFTVQPQQRGVVLFLGKYDRTTGPGFHFRYPYPIEEVFTPNVTRMYSIEIGFRSGGSNTQRMVQDEARMLTGDENVIESQMIVRYQIDPAQPENYLFNVVGVEDTLKDIAESAERQVIGDNAIDAALTEGRNEIQTNIKEIIQKISNRYVMGILIDEVQLLTTQPPGPVEPAFNDVVNAREDKNRFINQAEAYKNEQIPQAEGVVQKTLQEAEAFYAERVNNAKGEVERFSSILKEYRLAPDITKSRLYLETLEKVLAGKPKLILNSDTQKDLLKFMNISPPNLPGATQSFQGVGR